MIKCSLVTLIFVVVIALALFNSDHSEHRIDPVCLKDTTEAIKSKPEVKDCVKNTNSLKQLSRTRGHCHVLNLRSAVRNIFTEGVATNCLQLVGFICQH